ncbi:MAG: TIGR00159 family protein [Crocinitomicaceae bacterium]|nr:TIGR00159 family protein [Crocinitomicaceae bacterium]|tara:strand:- start:3497 stop:4291 length:795 start_codon:yes stop_codon:yes gene_type:complete
MIQGFITLRWLDVLDILLVAFLLYQLYQLVKGTAAIRIFIGILIIIIAWKVTEVLQMELVSNILGQFIGIGAIAVIVIFQQELRRFLVFIANNSIFRGKRRRHLFNFNFLSDNNVEAELNAHVIAVACQRMSIDKTGALMVFPGKTDLSNYIETGTKINAEASASLLESIFFHNSPLHDGAVIFKHNRIAAAGCVLPLSESKTLPQKYGLRHRAAVGITEISDAVALVISEERGTISIIARGRIDPIKKTDVIEDRLKEALGLE